jgi:hypothetical protein
MGQPANGEKMTALSGAGRAGHPGSFRKARPPRLRVVVRGGPRAVTPRVGPIIDRVTGGGQCAPLVGSSVTGLVSDGAAREEM